MSGGCLVKCRDRLKRALRSIGTAFLFPLTPILLLAQGVVHWVCLFRLYNFPLEGWGRRQLPREGAQHTQSLHGLTATVFSMTQYDFQITCTF